MAWIQPAPSYRLLLPDHIRQEYGDDVVSFWQEQPPAAAIQLASVLRRNGEQVTAAARLSDLMEQEPGNWEEIAFRHPHFATSAAATVMEENVLWLHAFLTDATGTIYVTISTPEPNIPKWTLDALFSLRRS